MMTARQYTEYLIATTENYTCNNVHLLLTQIKLPPGWETKKDSNPKGTADTDGEYSVSYDLLRLDVPLFYYFDSKP